MKIMIILLTIVFACTCAGSILAGQFIDDFQDPVKTKMLWEVIHLEWVVEDGHYWSPGAPGLTEDAITLLNIEAEDGMVIEAQCGDKGGGNWSNFAVVYAYEEEDVVWAAGAGVGNDQWRMFKFTPVTAAGGGGWGSDFVGGVAVKTLLEVGEWYNIRIEINGRNVTLSASSEPESENLDEGNTCTLPSTPTGRIGLGGAGASPMFNWIKVTGPNVPSLGVMPGDRLVGLWGGIKKGLVDL